MLYLWIYTCSIMRIEPFPYLSCEKEGGLPYNDTQSCTFCIGIFQKFEDCGLGREMWGGSHIQVNRIRF